MNAETTPLPPWVRYPAVAPTWGGFRQGESEQVFLEWLDFWKSRDPMQRDAYLERWPVPDEDWLVYVTEYWVR